MTTIKLLMPDHAPARDLLEAAGAPVGRDDHMLGADLSARRAHDGTVFERQRRRVLVDRRAEARRRARKAEREAIGIEMAAAAVVDAAEESLRAERRDRSPSRSSSLAWS